MYKQDTLKIKSEEVLKYLSKGSQNPVTMYYLQQQTGFSKRVVSACIQYLRSIGYPICSGSNTNPGYFLGDVQDLRKNIQRISVILDGYLFTYVKMTNILEDMENVRND